MKFAHDFKATLAEQDFPNDWVQSAIPYSQLKKCLKKVQLELQGLGLDAETLRSLLNPDSSAPLALQYNLNNDETNVVHPKLTMLLHFQEGFAVDASLSSASKTFFKKLVTDIHQHDAGNKAHFSPATDANHATEQTSATNSEGEAEVVEIPLVFDTEFFDLLQSDVQKLEALQSRESKNLTNEVMQLKAEVGQVSKPSRFSKNDLVRWREIFELYLDAGVFFANLEQDHGARSSQRAFKQLKWFQDEVEKRNLATAFKLSESRQAFRRFLSLNGNILKNLQFQELNSLAVSKILKKFDKRTALGVSKTFPKAIHSGKLLSGSIARDVCSVVSQELMTVLPQINDYLCPVCFSLAYRPVRLDCQHVFCIRCIIKIQRRGERHCPLCRADVVMSASADNLDRDLEKYLRTYFPKEVKEKQRANEIERGVEDYGPSYKHQECTLM